MFHFIALTALLASAAAFQPRLDGRIVGGENANIQDYPYQLSLQYNGRHTCGASIISSRWAVTAAHCTGESTDYLTVVAGISKLKEERQRIQIAKIHQHPDFSVNTLDKDVSVLELASDINFSDTAQPISLAPEGYDPFHGTEVVVTGWGSLSAGGFISNKLQKVSVKIVKRDTCKEAYGSRITDYMVCAGVLMGGKDACNGDSGGPLVANGKLVGIVSFGYRCAQKGYPGVYANVGALRSFIKQASGI